MSAFSSSAFSTDSFSVLAFDFGGVTPTPSPSLIPEGWASGSYVTRMSEAEFERRRKRFWKDLIAAESRIKMLDAVPDLHAAIMAPDGETFEQKRARELRLSSIVAKRIIHEHDMEVQRIKAAADEADDEDMLINFLMN